MRLILLAFLASCLVGCTPDKLEESALSPQERALVRAAIQDVANNDAGKLAQRVPPQAAPKVASAMPLMRTALPQGPFEVSLAAANWNTVGSSRRMNAVYEVKGKDGWALVEATIESSGGRLLLDEIYFQRTPGDPKNLNAFKLSDAGLGGWAMLTAMIAAVGITIGGLFRIWKSGLFRRRWLWTLGALIGLTSFRLNWTTGQWSFQPISIQLLSVSAFKQPIFAPWVFAVGIPAVALVALFRRSSRGSEGHDLSSDITRPSEH
ncbi:MAG: hypothetical protein V4513_10045 [Pseudomonadota bacterium]